ncbi:hypothetical protein BD626DRAFT_486736 [Schizophyllum amplum]|uniref:DUF1754-domain-containing protein n=1 Tax=Schizophyllum amplum TaxID=97359 RepID=A0A550CMT1_9AGAR|nr:hypothetical protein BD626DRAFT_486736 [Auriculariopsis ampla]
MSDYVVPIGGSLKLKGGVAEGGVVKKKKKSKSKPKPAESEIDIERKRVKELLLKDDGDANSPSTSGRNSPAVGGSSNGDRRTEAEKRFEEIQRRRLQQKIGKLAGKTHKERVQQFNEKLESLSEHHDIPKVGPG